MHRSFTAPFTASGRSALVPPPPWHYAGWLINVAFTCDPAQGAQLLPPARGRLTGHGCVHFADWQACGDGGAELLDPVYAQYRETIVVLEFEAPSGERFNYCPFIYVDQDISLLRGLLQGWPKKAGRTWLTRSLPLDHPAAAPLAAGSRFGASLCVKDRRLLDARLALTGEPGQALGFFAAPTLGAVGWPDLRDAQALPEPRFVRSRIDRRVESGWHAATAQLTLADHPVEELGLLGPLQAGGASVGWAALTVLGAADA
jgi:hypothetical protein